MISAFGPFVFVCCPFSIVFLFLVHFSTHHLSFYFVLTNTLKYTKLQVDHTHTTTVDVLTNTYMRFPVISSCGSHFSILQSVFLLKIEIFFLSRFSTLKVLLILLPFRFHTRNSLVILTPTRQILAAILSPHNSDCLAQISSL